MHNQADNLADLLRRARSGDRSAEEELFGRCRNYLNVIARTRVETWMRARVDASDLVQQTLLDAHRGFARFQGTTSGEWLVWLKQVLLHNTQDFIRQQRAAKRGEGPERSLNAASGDDLDPLAAELTTPSALLMAHERELALADSLTKLAPDHQEVLQLRSLQRLSFEEVAERMGRSRPAVQMLWMRALEKLEVQMRGKDC